MPRMKCSACGGSNTRPVISNIKEIRATKEEWTVKIVCLDCNAKRLVVSVDELGLGEGG